MAFDNIQSKNADFEFLLVSDCDNKLGLAAGLLRSRNIAHLRVVYPVQNVPINISCSPRSEKLVGICVGAVNTLVSDLQLGLILVT